MTISEKELSKRKEILSECLPLIRYYLVTLYISPKAIDDIAQEVYIAASKTIGGLDSMDNINRWLYTVTKRVAFQCVKKEIEVNTWETRVLSEDWEIEADTLEQALDNLHIMKYEFGDEKISELVEGLDSPAPQILRLRFVGGYKLREIAEILNVNYNTVRTIEHRALLKLKDIIQERRVAKD